MSKYRGPKPHSKPKSAMRKARKNVPFLRFSNSDPTKQVRGLFFTYEEQNAVLATREILSWAVDAMDELYPDTQFLRDERKRQQEKADAAAAEQEQNKQKESSSADSNVNQALLGTEVDKLLGGTDGQGDAEAEDEEDDGFMLFASGSSSAREKKTDSQATTGQADAALSESKAQADETKTEEEEGLDESRKRKAPLDQASQSGTGTTKRVREDETSDGPALIQHTNTYPRLLELSLGFRGVTFLEIIDPEVDVNVLYDFMVLKQLIEEKRTQSRYTTRLFPISTSCFSSLESLDKIAAKYVPQAFENAKSGQTFCTVLDRRTKIDTMPREEVMSTVAKHVPWHLGLTVEYKQPYYGLVVQIVGRATFLGMVRDYSNLQKCNLQALSARALQATLKPVPKPPTQPAPAQGQVATRSEESKSKEAEEPVETHDTATPTGGEIEQDSVPQSASGNTAAEKPPGAASTAE